MKTAANLLNEFFFFFKWKQRDIKLKLRHEVLKRGLEETAQYVDKILNQNSIIFNEWL